MPKKQSFVAAMANLTLPSVVERHIRNKSAAYLRRLADRLLAIADDRDLATERSAGLDDFIPLEAGREVHEVREVGTVTYRCEAVRCGKPRCKCTSGALHGPYWYAYYRDPGSRLRSTYIGKEFAELTNA